MAFINSLNYILPSRSACIPRDAIKVNRPSPGISKAVLGTAGLQGGGGGGEKGRGGEGRGEGGGGDMCTLLHVCRVKYKTLQIIFTFSSRLKTWLRIFSFHGVPH